VPNDPLTVSSSHKRSQTAVVSACCGLVWTMNAEELDDVLRQVEARRDVLAWMKEFGFSEGERVVMVYGPIPGHSRATVFHGSVRAADGTGLFVDWDHGSGLKAERPPLVLTREDTGLAALPLIMPGRNLPDAWEVYSAPAVSVPVGTPASRAGPSIGALLGTVDGSQAATASAAVAAWKARDLARLEDRMWGVGPEFAASPQKEYPPETNRGGPLTT
jgi:hypothetical protein